MLDEFLRFVLEIKPGTAILVSGILVVLGWYFESRRSLAIARRENAHRYLLSRNKIIKESRVYLVKELSNKQKLFPKYNLNYPIRSIEQVKQQKLIDVLNEMETLSVDIKLGTASEVYVQNVQYTFFVDVFESSREFIQSVRNRRDQQSLFRNLEIAYIRMKFRRNGIVIPTVELLLNRPLYKWSYIRFKFILKIMNYILCEENENYLSLQPIVTIRKLRAFRRATSSLFVIILLVVVLMFVFGFKFG